MLKEQIERYTPSCEQEERDKAIILKYFEAFDDVLTRNNEIGHFSASAWAVNKDRTKVLMIYHNIYNSWAWTGGHADGEENLLDVAVRELKEETGVKNINVVSDDILGIDVLHVERHIKRGKFISSHMHLNLTYLIEVDEADQLIVKEDENKGVKWISVDDINNEVSEDGMKIVYAKMVEKSKKYGGVI